MENRLSRGEKEDKNVRGDEDKDKTTRREIFIRRT